MAISKVIFPLSSFQGFRQQQVPLCSNCCSREESSSSHQWIVRSLIDWTGNFQFSFESNSQVHWFCLSTYIGGLEKKKAKKKGMYKWKKDINNLKKMYSLLQLSTCEDHFFVYVIQCVILFSHMTSLTYSHTIMLQETHSWYSCILVFKTYIAEAFLVQVINYLFIYFYSVRRLYSNTLTYILKGTFTDLDTLRSL